MNKYIVMSLATAFVVTNVNAQNLDDIPMAKLYPLDADVTKVSAPVAVEKKVVVKKKITKEIKPKVKAKKKKIATNSTDARLKKLEKKIKKLQKTLSKVKQHDAYDNVKFNIEFRNSIDNINYKYHSYKTKDKAGNVVDWAGQERSNDALLSSRLYLNMKAKPMEKLTFNGQLAMYGTWGGSHLSHDSSLKDWSESSKSTDTIFRLRQAYFSWKDTFGDDGLPYSFSIGRRWSADGMLGNYRENLVDPGSALAHITNMEVNGAMFKLETDKYLSGSFLKFVAGRAHTGGIHTLNDVGGYQPYAQADEDYDENVDFLVFFANLYNDGQYLVKFENAFIPNTKGARTGTPIAGTLPDGHKNKSLDAGSANLTALSMQSSGIGDEINDFLDETTAFASIAMTTYDPDSGKQLLGSTESETGYSYWVGLVIPDMITKSGKLGFEYNHGSQYWTPMTWAEDTAIGSKIAVRGSAYEAYWNFELFGAKNLSSQIRYTHLQHDYTPNIRCSGWVPSKPVDIEADDIRFFVKYSY
jgi:hypothetical protein